MQLAKEGLALTVFITNLRLLTAFAPILVATSAAVLARAQTSQASSSLNLPPGFHSGTAAVNGTTLHYVRGGNGPAVILLHGFPEDWVRVPPCDAAVGEEVHGR